MFQPAILGLCVSLLADLLPAGAGTRVDLASGARAELNVGRIPVTSVDDSEAGTEETLLVRSGIRLVSPTSTLTLTYQPRYYLRLPDALGVGRPLILHQATLGWAKNFSRRASLAWNLNSSAGDVPFSGFSTVFEPGTGRVTAKVIPIVQLNTSLSMTAQTGKRHTTSALLGASHYDSLGGGDQLQRSDNLSASLSHAFAFSRRTSGGITAGIGYGIPESNASSATIGGQLFVSQRLRESATLRVAAGMSEGWVDGGSVSWPLPTVDIGYASKIDATGQSWNVNLAGGTRAFFDVAAATYRPQLYLAARVAGKILNTWTVAPSLTFSTDISGIELTPNRQPTQLYATVPFAYRIAQNFDFVFGVRMGLSGPAPSAWGTGEFQDQLSVYVALDWGTGTEKSQGGWL